MARKPQKRRAPDAVDYAAAVSPLDPPATLPLRTDLERQRFDEIISSAARDTWTPARLALAAEYARNCTRIDEMTEDVEQLGFVESNRFGEDRERPIVNVLFRMSNRNLTILRSLGLPSEPSRKSASQNEARQTLQESGKQTMSSLVARPAPSHGKSAH